MKKILMIAACAALSGCATHDVVYKPVPVQTIVSVPCHIPVINKPAMPVDAVTTKNTMFEQVRSLLAEREIRRGYESMLEASTKACQ